MLTDAGDTIFKPHPNKRKLRRNGGASYGCKGEERGSEETMKKIKCFPTIILLLSLCLFTQGAPMKRDFPPHLEGALTKLWRAAVRNPAVLTDIIDELSVTFQAGLVEVVIRPKFYDPHQVDFSRLQSLGVMIETVSKNLVLALVPVERLKEVAETVSGVAFVRRPYRPYALAITSEGVSLTGASTFHSEGYYGQGAKVAIIDLGFQGLSEAVNAGELANVVYTYDYTGTGLETGTEHGTAVAEIVHDMAPQADLYLFKIGNEVHLQEAVDYCVSDGIHIINHSVGWFNTNFYDGTGVIAETAAYAREQGILWINAAGNYASDGHWQGSFKDLDGDGWLDFGFGKDYLDADIRDEDLRIWAQAGEVVLIYLTWDDWPASDQDYDLYLYDSSGNLVASSTASQTGTQEPSEAIKYSVMTSGYYGIGIKRYSAPQAPVLELFAFKDGAVAALNMEYHQPQSSLPAPANAAKALTVGAINYVDWSVGPQAPYSSQGPTNQSKFSSSITKPDVMGPDGVSSYAYSGQFYGTSAAAPHVAGAAALLLSEDPTRTAGQLEAKLIGDAVDMGPSGKDNVYGWGRLNLVLSGGPPPSGGVWEDDMESGQKWSVTGLWHLTTRKAHSPSHSQWFGDETTGTYGAGGTASMGARGGLQPQASGQVTGTLTSPQIPLGGGSAVTLSFWHWRHVEYYTKGSYDKTYVEVRYSTTGWQQVWYQDSKTPSQKQWQQVTINLNVPSGATWLQVRFVFDSVDGYYNEYPGWFIDDVRVEGVEAPSPGEDTTPPDTQITSGPSGTISQTTVTFQWTGSDDVTPTDQLQYSYKLEPLETTWSSWTTATSETYSGLSAGDYTFYVQARDAAGNVDPTPASRSFTVSTEAPPSGGVWEDDMESGQKWSVTGLWHLTTRKAHSPSHSQWFGDETTGTYGAGGTASMGARGGLQPQASGQVTGTLTSPQIPLGGGSAVTLSFWHWRHVEYYTKGSYDKTYVEVRYSTTGWQQVWYQDSKTPSQKQWQQVTINLNVPSGATWLQVRFVFDSVDSYYNEYPGWFIDDVRISEETSASSTDSASPGLVVEPNPFSDSCTFTVIGLNVDRLGVVVYDLLGRKVGELYREGANSVNWAGVSLRNGAYIYVAHVYGEGRSVVFRGFVYVKH